MTWLAYLGGAALLGFLAWLVAALWAARHIAKVAPGAPSAPTPEEAKVIVETKRTAGEIAAAGEKKQREVLGADKTTTLRAARDFLWRRVRKP